MARKRALIIGIDHYDDRSISNLSNAVADAMLVANYLSTNEPQYDGDVESENYDIKLLISKPGYPITRRSLLEEINWLFAGNLDGALFYFAGHAVRSKLDDNDYLVSSDGRDDAFGVDMSLLMRRANEAGAKGVRSSTIILDCCHAGAAGNSDFSDHLAQIGKGVTLLTSCEENEKSRDSGGRDGHGAFTSILLDGLEGQSADILGRVTPASLYALIDSRLGATEQRPVYKTNVSRFIEVRKCTPRIQRSNLMQLTTIFTKPAAKYSLNPQHERIKDRGKGFEDVFGENIQFKPELFNNYRALQDCFKNGLINVLIPQDKPEGWDVMTDNAAWPPKKSGSFSMWHAAIFSASVELNYIGKHYRELALQNRLG